MNKILDYFDNNLKLKNWVIFFAITISFISFELIYYLIGIDFQNLTNFEFVILESIKYLFFIILLFIMHRKYLIEKWSDFKKNFVKYFQISFKDWLCGLAIMLFANMIISDYISGLGENENAVQNLISTIPAFALIMTTIFAPITEELIFRKTLKDCFNNPIIYMIFSGLIFGFIHVMGSSNPLEYLLIISYGALGFMFARTLNKTDNIYCTIMMHMIHNGLLTILALVV